MPYQWYLFILIKFFELLKSIHILLVACWLAEHKSVDLSKPEASIQRSPQSSPFDSIRTHDSLGADGKFRSHKASRSICEQQKGTNGLMLSWPAKSLRESAAALCTRSISICLESIDDFVSSIIELLLVLSHCKSEFLIDSLKLKTHKAVCVSRASKLESQIRRMLSKWKSSGSEVKTAVHKRPALMETASPENL